MFIAFSLHFQTLDECSQRSSSRSSKFHMGYPPVLAEGGGPDQFKSTFTCGNRCGRGNGRWFRWLFRAALKVWKMNENASWHAMKVDEFPWLPLFVRNLRNVHGEVFHDELPECNCWDCRGTAWSSWFGPQVSFWSAEFFCKRYLSGNLVSFSSWHLLISYMKIKHKTTRTFVYRLNRCTTVKTWYIDNIDIH
jgi:hypothetical protein